MILSHGHPLLLTEFGPLDVLDTVAAGQDYGDLIKDSDVFEVAGIRFHVPNLTGLIRLKEAMGSAKDRAALEVLRAVKEEKDYESGKRTQLRVQN